jgi:Tol biopolymer transport system component/DNA-binding winged helix-turn-helix (wHTH) protein
MMDDSSEVLPPRRLDLANATDFQIGGFRVRPAYREVRRGDVIDILEPRVMQVLTALARRLGTVVSRDELLRECWGDVSVTDDSLHRCIGRLRRLADSDGGASFTIETVPRVGYRLVPTPSAQAPRTEAITPAPVRKPPRRLWIGLGVLAVAVAAGAMALWRAQAPERWQVARFETVVDTPEAERQPALSPSGGLLAYTTAQGSGSRDIVLRNLREGTTSPLMGGPDDDTSPAWSPSGDRIAFVRARPSQPCEILTHALPAGPDRSLARCASAAAPRLAWSADGGRILFSDAAAPGTPAQIRAIPADGGPAQAITHPPAGMAGDQTPVVSPDGRQIAFVRWVGSSVSDILVQDLAGGPAHPVTRDRATVTGLAWSPSGKSLFFASNRGGDYGVWAVPIRGGEPTRLGSGLREVRRLSSGPGGALAMELADVRANLSVIGGPQDGQTITAEAGLQWAGDVGPDGTLAYMTDARSGMAVWSKAPGQAARKLTFFPTTEMDDLRWSPDGKRLAFVAVRQGRWIIYVLDASGGEPKALASADDQLASPAWEADGRGVVFTARKDGVWRILRADAAGARPAAAISGPGWIAVRPSADGLLALKAGSPGVWRLGPQGEANLVSPDFRTPPGPVATAWIVKGDRQYWIDWPAVGTPKVLSSSIRGGPSRVVAEAPGAPAYSGLALDSATGAFIYTRTVRDDADIGLMTLAPG